VARRGASRGTRKRTPALLWLLAGILIGLGLAWYLAAKGIIPQPPATQPVAGGATRQAADEPVLTEEISKPEEKPGKPRYDFFTVLPEMEVVVPEQELAKRREPTDPAASSADTDTYLLQVGSFRSAAEADQMKAQLALSGFVATVEPVTVNEATWHRVRIGPVKGLQQADDIRRRLADNSIDSLVMKIP
jgi:cell division protein FtsN